MIQVRLRNVWLLWLLYGVSAAALRFGHAGVFGIYREAGQAWLLGEPLYDGTGNSFIYFPTAAHLASPFAALPIGIGGALWRIGNIGIFALGIRRISHAHGTNLAERRFACVSVFAMALSWSSARHGQATLAMSGFLFHALVSMEERRWLQSAAGFTAGLALKPLALPFALVSAALSRSLCWRTLVLVGAAAVLPLALKDPAYVASQYQAVPSMLQLVANRPGHPEHGFADLFSMLRTWNLEVTQTWSLIIRGCTAAGTLLVSWWIWRAPGHRRRAEALYALSACYVLLMSPATERNTYALLAPAIGLQWLDASKRRSGPELLLLGTVTGLFLASHPLTHAFPGSPLCAVKPLAALLFLAALLSSLSSTGREPRVRNAQTRSQNESCNTLPTRNTP